MNITKDTLVGQVVREAYPSARIFDQYGIDFCCGGERSIGQACTENGVEPDLLLNDLQSVAERPDRTDRYIQSMPLPALCEYIVEVHHRYVRQQIPYIGEKLQKLRQVHGDHHPELTLIHEMFETASRNLLDHMTREETELFPLASKLTGLAGQPGKDRNQAAELLDRIGQLRDDHQAEGDRFKEMSKLTRGFTVPEDGCNTYRVAFQSLQDFEEDLHRHVHLENNILFPEMTRVAQEPGNLH